MATRTARKPKPPAQTARNQGSLNKIGALWLSEGKNGKFMSGRIQLDDEQNEIRILVFKNDYKEQSKHPDYIIYEPSEEPAQSAGKDSEITDDDVPF